IRYRSVTCVPRRRRARATARPTRTAVHAATLTGVSGTALFIALFVLVALVVAAVVARRARRRAEDEGAEDTAQARRWVERLAGQVERVPPRSEPARRSMEAAEDRLERARGMLPRAAAPADAVRIHETAIEGLHYVRAAHEADGDPPGAPLPPAA